MSLRLLAFAALGVVAGAIVPSTSHAQLGKLTKKATDAASNAAGVPTGNARYVKKIDLSSAQLAQVNKGLEVAVKQGPEIIKRWEKQQEDNDKALGEYTKKKEKYDACVESEKEKAQAKIDAASKRTDKAGSDLQKGMPDTAAMMAQAQAAQAAAERVKNGTATAADRQTLADYQKMMAGVQGGANAVASAMQENTALQQAVADSIKKHCGAEPQPPASAASGSSRAGKAGSATPTSAAEEINQASASAAGMSDSEFRLAKEKAMGYAASNTQVQGGADTPPMTRRRRSTAHWQTPAA